MNGFNIEYMKKLYFTPGPSQLYFTVEEHLKTALKNDIPSISHRGSTFETIYKSCTENIKSLLNLPKDYHVFFMSSATEIWERIGQNLIEFESFHLVNGAFSAKFQSIVSNLNKTAFSQNVPEGEVVDVNSVLIPETTELISMTFNETSTGASHQMSDIEKMREAFPSQLLALDVVSVTPSVAIDFSKVDTAYFSVQKCFGLPAGLGVWIVNERCIEKSQHLLNQGNSIGSYHCIPEFLNKAKNNQTPATPNVLNLYLLSKVTEDMLLKGIDQIRLETNYKSALLQHTISESPFLDHFVTNIDNRSKTTTVATTLVDSNKIIDLLSKNGLIIGSGYGKHKSEHIRIANFPTHSKEQIELLSDQILSLNI
jgi:phosphoserine aminotransferase